MTRYGLLAAVPLLALGAPALAQPQSLDPYAPPPAQQMQMPPQPLPPQTEMTISTNPAPGETVETTITPGAPPPPPTQATLVPSVPTPGFVWVPGHYNWDPASDQYIWLVGQYMQPPHTGAHWAAGRWVLAGPRGWMWIDGHFE